VGVRRMMWGSDFPFGGLGAPVYSLAKVQTLPLGDEEKSWILHRTAEALVPALATGR